MFSLYHDKSNDYAWKEFSRRVNGIRELGKHTLFGRITYEVYPWVLVLDTYARAMPTNIDEMVEGLISTDLEEYTRLQTQFTNHDAFICEIYSSSFPDMIWKFFGMQDIKIGDKLIDREFIIKSNDKNKISVLLQNNEIRDLLQILPNIHLRVNSESRLFSSLHPAANNEVILEINEVITDLGTLSSMHEFFIHFLNNLCILDTQCIQYIDKNDLGI